MTFALLPVKIRKAKQRLSCALSLEDREALAEMMFEQVYGMLRAVQGLERIVVMTTDQKVAAEARRTGALVLDEPELVGHKNSADRAAQYVMQIGATCVVMLPIDVPLVQPHEIEELIAAAMQPPAPRVVIVPSFDGSGTNALALRPPDAMQTLFGENSFRGHMDAAAALGLPVQVLHPRGLTLDIDTPEDVTELFNRAPQSKVAEFLREKCPPPPEAAQTA